LRAIRSEGIVAGGVEEYAGFFDGFPVHLGVDENTMIGCSILRAFGEGWDKQIPGKELRGQSSGIPHLAKNERDVGHPSFGGDGEDRALMGLRPSLFIPRTLV
jgi:hypothetical protein